MIDSMHKAAAQQQGSYELFSLALHRLLYCTDQLLQKTCMHGADIYQTQQLEVHPVPQKHRRWHQAGTQGCLVAFGLRPSGSADCWQ